MVESLPGVRVCLLEASHADEFVRAVEDSVGLHAPWVQPPSNVEEFWEYLLPERQECFRFGVFAQSGRLAGVININAILRGAFQNGSLGFYAFEGFQRRGLMRAAARVVIDRAFAQYGLHRLEANVQPGNQRSCLMVERLGFRLEGVTPRMLRIDGAWRDHRRYALTIEEWSLQTAEPGSPSAIQELKRA
jgi:ribosomal-protein-alanine N-acetyltransferase